MSILQPTPAPQIRPFVRIIVQPTKSVRFRYSCEDRPGTIQGASSTADNKIPFTIQIEGYQGRVGVLISCVTNDQPYRPHPHKLVGHPKCKDGVCYLEDEVTKNNSVIRFPKLAVQCVKIRDVQESLKVREEKRIDPFRTGFTHKNDVKSIDLSFVRLCVQVFPINERNERTVLGPVVSESIYNKKTYPDPVIFRLSHCNSYVDGRDDDMILLCTKIAKENIRIRFFETLNNELVWEDYATFDLNHVYNQTAICFRPPKYYNQHILGPAMVCVDLVRPSDGVHSPPCHFEYLPISAKPGFLKEKRVQYDGNMPFAQFIQSCSSGKVSPSGSVDMGTLPKIPRLEKIDLLVDVPCFQPLTPLSTPEEWLPKQDLLSQDLPFEVSTPSTSESNLPLFVNNINQRTPSSSRRNTEEEIPCFNIPNNINMDSGNGISRLLEMDVETFNINSGDLEMYDVNRLSGSLKEFAIS